MRVQSIEVDGFRAFSSSEKFDFDADAIIVSGANGQGKTSILDAVLWGLTGRINRLGEGAKDVVSKFSDTGSAMVEIVVSRDSDPVRIRRRFDGERENLTLIVGTKEYRGEAASAELLRLLWPKADQSEDGIDALGTAITTSVYLQQDTVRKFIEADSDRDRFDAASELVGTGRVTDLQRELESGKSNWTKATTQRTAELSAYKSALMN